jgi:lysozyme
MDSLLLSVKIIKQFEGCRLKAYQDIVGVWTIGYGETLNVKAGMVWTQQEADSALIRRVGWFMSSVLKSCPQLHLEPPERVAACVSLAYNIGVGAFRVSSVCRLSKQREWEKAAKSFLLWNKAGGRVVRGLTLRRITESNLFKM